MPEPSEQRTSQERPQGEPPGWRIEGLRRPADGPGSSGQRGPGRPTFRFGRIWWIVIGLLFLNWLIVDLLPSSTERLEIPYTSFRREVAAGNVDEITSRGDTIQGHLRREITFPGPDDTPTIDPPKPRTSDLFQTERPAFADDGLIEVLLEQKVIVNARPVDEGRSLFWTVILSFGPVILLVALFVVLSRRMAGAAGGIGGLGRSRAKRYDATQQRTTFEDVAGIDEAEEELVEVVDFLKNPDKYRKLGAAIPKGVLLSGLPGTGKTLLARAVAGEANVPFFSLSASEFVEMIVGVGASRVRDLFKQAKEAAPAIVFIDELDAIGRARGSSGAIGGHDEREQTLNQILTEMDGFTGSEGVIVLAATNRPEVLDAALLRPGRFDRRVVVNPPDQAGRAEILRVHTRKVPLAADVDLASIASTTPGMVGADLKNLVNEAALMAARRGHDQVGLADFTDSLEKIVLGAERRIMLSPEERERTAYHESGHAILGMLIPGADPVRKVSIVPRGRALGVTFQSPESDRYGYDVAYLRGRIVGALGGRAAEDLVYGNVTTGAESDLEQVTRIARQMVGRWGMSDAIGPVSVLPGPNDEPLLFPGTPGSASEKTRELVDGEVRRIVEECYTDARRLLAENRSKLEALAKALLEHETLDEEDAYRTAGVERRRSTASFGGGPAIAADTAVEPSGD